MSCSFNPAGTYMSDLAEPVDYLVALWPSPHTPARAIHMQGIMNAPPAAMCFPPLRAFGSVEIPQPRPALSLTRLIFMSAALALYQAPRVGLWMSLRSVNGCSPFCRVVMPCEP